MKHAWLRSFAWPLLLVFVTHTDGALVRWTNGTAHDFGELRIGHTAVHRFVFENAASEPIVLQAVRTECGCTVADWSEEPIRPQQKSEVAIEFYADRSGYFRKKIKVYFDRQRRAEVLWISGTVIE